MSFGPGDISANDWASSGANTYWTNYSTVAFSSGSLFRPIALACRWGSDSGSVTGHNDIWMTGPPYTLQAYSVDASIGLNTFGSYNNMSAAANWFLPNSTFYAGFFRTASGTCRVPFRDGSGGNYGGQSANDGDISAATNNWAGVGNPGGLGWLVTTQNDQLFIWRGGAWIQFWPYVFRSGGWSIIIVWIWRSGTWSPLNWFDWMNRSERHIPAGGMRVTCDVGEGMETGWIVEEPGDVGWFGQLDPAGLGLEDWRKPGIYTNVPYPAPWTGRHSSHEPEALVEQRLHARFMWDRAIKAENQREAEHWFPRWAGTLPMVRPAGVDRSLLSQAA